MGIVLAFLILFIVLTIIAYLLNKTCHDIVFISVACLAIFACLALLITIGCVVCSNIAANAYTTKLQQTYNSLTYQLENIDTLYGESRANDRKELFNQIQKWNEKIVSGRVYHTNPWTNWLEPVDYGEFELIELK